MKTLFIPVKFKDKIKSSLINEISEKLPKKIAICYSVQFENQAKEIRNNLKEKEITDFIQVLGCSNPRLKSNPEAILLIGEGKFHSVSLEYETKIPVFLVENNKLIKVSKEEVEKKEKLEKGAYLKFLNSKNVGVLITTKPGQSKLNRALELKNKLKNKKTYFFLGNELSVKEFENFKIDSWINTACPRMDLEDSRIINMNKIKE